MGKGYNNYMTKKPFHPGSKANIKRTWMAEQRTENEKRKQEELKVQYEKEQDLYNNRALLSTESKDKLELNFMYEAPPGAKRERQKEDDEPEYKFEWQRKYNAPREDYAKGNADIRDQPFGIPVRNVRCIKCHKWGHINTDKECPLFNSSSASSMPTTSMDPLELMRQMREDGYNLKQNVLGHHVNPRLANQQYVHSDEEDDGEEDPEMEFLKSLTSKQKKKLLKKLNKLSKKQKKKEAAKKKKQIEKETSDSDSAEDLNKKTKKKKQDLPSEHQESSSEEEMQQQQHDIPTSTRDKNSQKSKKRHKEEDAEDTVEPKKGKRSHPSGESKSDNRSSGNKHSVSKQDEKRHKKRKDSKKYGESNSSSSEEDNYRRAKKRLPDMAVDVSKPEKSKKDDSDDGGFSNSKSRKHGFSECKKDKKKGKHDSRQSDSQSSPEKEKKSHKEKSHGDKKSGGHVENYDSKDRDVLQHPNKKNSPSSHKNVYDISSTSKEGTAESKNTSGSPIKSEKTCPVSKSMQKSETADFKKSIHPREMDVQPSTSKQSEHSSEDEEDEANFVKPPKLSSSKNKSPSTRRISPEHPDGFSHEFPQRKSSGKVSEEASTSNSDPKYLGNSHDRFRNLHRHRRSPSIKHKYQS